MWSHISLEDVRDNKNLKITAKKISDKYRKLRNKKNNYFSTKTT